MTAAGNACTFGRPRASNGDTRVRGPVIRTLLKTVSKSGYLAAVKLFFYYLLLKRAPATSGQLETLNFL